MSTWITQLHPPPGDGVRLAVKDAIAVEGVPTTAGSAALAATAQPETTDAAVVANARAAGARILGKTNLHELCCGGTGVNPHFGTPPNPFDPERIPGGSSSGSGVAVANDEADVAFGTDTGGSIRNPAACCGVSGLKTTVGRIPLDGVLPLAPTMDTVGPMARDVAGLVLGMELLEPGFSADVSPATRIGRVRPVRSDPGIDEAVDNVLGAAEVEVEPVFLPGWNAAGDYAFSILVGECLESWGELYREHREVLSPDVGGRMDKAAAFKPGFLDTARSRRTPWRAQLAEAFAKVQLLALPTMPWFPPYIDDASPVPNPAASPVNLAGHPAVAIPIPTAGKFPGRFPASLQLVGPDGSEELLLATAAVMEKAAAAIAPGEFPPR